MTRSISQYKTLVGSLCYVNDKNGARIKFGEFLEKPFEIIRVNDTYITLYKKLTNGEVRYDLRQEDLRNYNIQIIKQVDAKTI